MKENDQPGIAFDSVSVERVIFNVMPDYEKPEGPIEIGLEFHVDQNFESDGKKLTVGLKVTTTFPSSPTPPMEIEVSVKGIFRLEKDDNLDFFNTFSEVQAPALLYPYAREVISTLTGKSRLPTLLLPPANLQAILKPKKKKAKAPKKK